MNHLQAHNLFHIPKMMCDRCVAALTSALHAFDGVARVEADLGARTVRNLVVSKRFGRKLSCGSQRARELHHRQ
jgi:copper chaperone